MTENNTPLFRGRLTQFDVIFFYHHIYSPLSHTSHPSLAVTLCELCMPKAFCGLETVRKIAQWTLCALWEKKLPSVREKPHHAPCKQASRGNLTYYAPPFGGGEGGGASWGKEQGQLGSVLGSPSLSSWIKPPFSLYTIKKVLYLHQ